MKKKFLWIFLAILFFVFSFCVFKFFTVKNYFKYLNANDIIYVNNIEQLEPIKLKGNEDIKIVSISNNKTTLQNISDKYSVEFLGNFEFDFSDSKDFIVAKSDDLSINISKDRSPYEDTFWYIEYYQNRFYTDENFRIANDIVLHENRYTEINGKKALILSLTKNFDTIDNLTYTYAFIQTNGQYYTRFMFKTSKPFSEEYQKTYMYILNSYTETSESGLKENLIYYANKASKKFFNIPELIKASQSGYFMDMHPIKNENWDEKTLAFYDSFSDSNDFKWGIFTENITTTAIDEKIPELEDYIDYKFDIILMYNHLGEPLPLETMKKMHNKDKIIELTVQTCANNNEKLFDYTPMFDIIEGKKDEQIRTLANGIKEFANPVLFRLNNEMNSDWTSYSGIICLSDPEIYKEVWHRIYNIFEEEGVTNCIWIFNPNDNNYPPSKWNNFLAYYPGNEYVHMIGVTGYNQGTYYAEKNGETWKSFKTIYDEINSKYSELFKDFPWIITEFASSSVGGNKAKWIEDMFKNIENYPNIKAAVWFSAADYDPDYTETLQVSRPYWLDETKETLDAFKAGLSASK